MIRPETLIGLFDELASVPDPMMEKVAITAWKRMFPALGGKMVSMRGPFGAAARSYGSQLAWAAENPAAYRAHVQMLKARENLPRVLQQLPAAETSDIAGAATRVVPTKKFIRETNKMLASIGRTYKGTPGLEQAIQELPGHPPAQVHAGPKTVAARPSALRQFAPTVPAFRTPVSTTQATSKTVLHRHPAGTVAAP